MTCLRAFIRNQSGATAAEFALVLPVALFFLLGTIDIGRYFWAINKVEKAVQAGTRYAVATRIVASGLNSVSYVGFACPGRTLKAGDTICREALGQVTCTGTGGAASCSCTADALGGAGSCPSMGAADLSAFNSIVHRMQVIDVNIAPSNVRVSYSGSGLGFAGDPKVDQGGNALSEISPVVTVEARGVRFRSISMLGYGLTLPNFRYSQTLEDGQGRIAY